MQETEIKQKKKILVFLDRVLVFLYMIGSFMYDGCIKVLKKLYRITGLRALIKYLGPVLPKDNLPQLVSHSVKNIFHRVLSILTGVSASTFEDKLSPKAKKKYARTALKRIVLFTIPVAIMCLSTFWVIHLQDYIAAYKVVIDGEYIATVEEPSDFYNVENYVSAYVTSLIGDEYAPEYTVAMRPSFAYAPSLSDSEEDIRACLLSHAEGKIVQSYGLYVDGELMLTDPSSEKLNSMLDDLKSAYLEGTGKNAANGQDRSVTFIQDVSVQQTFVSAAEDSLDTETQFIKKIVAPIASATSSASIENQLLSRFDSSKIYQTLAETDDNTSGMPISVKVVQMEEYETYQGYSTERIADSSLTKGATKVVQQGVKGVTKVLDEVYLIDGREVSRATISKTVVSQPVKQIVHYGTKVSVVTGRFMRPVSGGSITSYYGYRKSGFHTGVDIARPNGTPIKAADGGKVTFAARSGGYGLLVKIDHGNGYVTYYAHCSAISVKVGQQVNKGDVIAKVGSTGNSSGNHLHFEVRLNGQHQNPLNYISKS